jgi:transcriptional regulator with XRE-family HTH domain
LKAKKDRMAHQTYSSSTREARILRAYAGDHIKQLRIQAGMTQKDLADKLALKHYTFISQLECGQGRLPPNLTIKCAQALGQDVEEFALKILSFYDPHTFEAITYNKKKEHLNG